MFISFPFAGFNFLFHNTFLATGNEAHKNLLIPMDHAITTKLGLLDREELYARSLHYVFNSKIVTSLSWYQQDWFQFAIIVIMVVITIVTWGTTGPAMAAAIAGATTSITAFIIAVIKFLLFQLALKLFVKLVGPVFAMVVAMIAMLYGAYNAYTTQAATQGATTASAATTTSAVTGAPWANELLELSNSLLSTVSDYYTDAIKDIQKDMLSFASYADEQYAALDEINKDFMQQTTINPLVVFGESPTEYYDRTIHYGNIGILGIDVVENYVSAALTLPELSQSLPSPFASA